MSFGKAATPVKTFVALDLAFHVAAGRAWDGEAGFPRPA